MKFAFEGPMMAISRRMFQSDLENLKALMESGRITAAPRANDDNA